MIRYLDICAGISAPTVAWSPLGWQALAYAEIADAPRAVLKHHYPETPLVGDFTAIRGDEFGPVELLVGGTPCQSFSVAGLRGGLADDRGNLALEYLRLADRARPRWLVWENVPGVLSSNGGRDFGAILGGMVELGYGVAYRVLDAQFFGVPQRRRRVFVVGHLGDWRRAAAVLFERHGLSGHPAPRRETGQGITASPQGIAGNVSSKWSKGSGGPAGDEHYNLIALTLDSRCGEVTGRSAETGGSLIAHAFKASHFTRGKDGAPAAVTPPLSADADKGDQDTLIAFTAKDHGGDALSDCSPTLRAGGHSKSHANAGVMPAVAFDTTQITSAANYSNPKPGDPCHPLASGAHPPAIAGSAARRLTPRECERLQGFPDDYTMVPHRGRMMADGPRYKCLGNSMAVPVVRWIGERIDAVEAIAARDLAA